jgi:hypothetical protein
LQIFLIIFRDWEAIRKEVGKLGRWEAKKMREEG